jgi:hypothetical protein
MRGLPEVHRRLARSPIWATSASPKAVLQRQKELDALMRAEADATAKAAAQAALGPPAEPAAATG